MINRWDGDKKMTRGKDKPAGIDQSLTTLKRRLDHDSRPRFLQLESKPKHPNASLTNAIRSLISGVAVVAVVAAVACVAGVVCGHFTLSLQQRDAYHSLLIVAPMSLHQAEQTPALLSLHIPSTSHDKPIHHAYLHPATMARLQLSCNQPASLTIPSTSSTALALPCLVHAWPDASIPVDTLQMHSAAAATFAFHDASAVHITPIVSGASLTHLPAAVELNILRWLQPVTVQSTLPASASADSSDGSADANFIAGSISRQLWGRPLMAGAFTLVSILSQPYLLHIASLTTASSPESISTTALITPDTAIHCPVTTTSPSSLVLSPTSTKPTTADWISHVQATFPKECAALNRFLTLRTHTLAPSASSSALLVCGSSGCGKTALLSVVASLINAPGGGAAGSAGDGSRGVFVRRLKCGEIIASSGAGSERSTVLSDAWEECMQVRDRPAVLVIDDLTPLLTTNNFPPLSSQLLALLDSTSASSTHPTSSAYPSPLLIAACDDSQPIASHWQRAGRFDEQLHVRPLAAAQRRRVLDWLVSGTASVKCDGELLEGVASRMHGCSVRQLVSVWRYAMLLWVEERMVNKEGQEQCVAGSRCNGGISWKQWETAILTVAPPTTSSSLLTTTSSTSSPSLQPTAADPFPLVGGYTALKKHLLLLIQSFLHPRQVQLRQSRVTHTLATFARPTGILLHGPSGCGKSLLLSSLAALANASAGTATGSGGGSSGVILGGVLFGVVWLHVASVLSPYLGESERQLRTVFEQAKANAPCLLLVDDLDVLVGSRGDGSGEDGGGGGGEEEGGATRLLTTLLVLLDGIDSSATQPVLLIATASSPSALDSALLRPGRLSNQLLVGLPTAGDRRLIVECTAHLDGLGWDESGMYRSEVSRRTRGCTGAELCGVVRDSAWLAWRNKRAGGEQEGRIEMRHVRDAMSAIGCLN